MRVSLLILAFSCMAGAALLARNAWAQQAEPLGGCLSPQEMREAVPEHHLADSYRVIKHVSSEHRAEAVGAKLCRQGGKFVYELTLLPHDAKEVLHVLVDAMTGETLSGKPPK
ncbi:PepSY domain-containing protein [Methylovirgula sp. 4M-Z18]|uniref:PepSY domain-containing protein n=1 Tax=Methylovirgula sp. 4M-Z18 TaxID=2293567 RepID=UPI0011C02BD4|nr:PepSY domain-containing protein [Methylovirgula sp. 4M-Z18]